LKQLKHDNAIKETRYEEHIASLEKDVEAKKQDILVLRTKYETPMKEMTDALHRLEDTLLLKEDMISKLQDNSETSVEEYRKETNAQEAKIQTLHEEIKHLKEKYQQTQIAFEKEIQTLEEVVEHQDKSILELECSQKDKDDETNKMDVMYYLNEGQSKESVAKQFGIPIKMVDLIIKFDKIKQEKSRTS